MLKNSSKRVCLIVAALSLLQYGVISAAHRSPQETVREYFSKDLEGARLSAETYKAWIAPLITWKDEPGWDTVFVTKKVYISKTKQIESSRVAIEVRYENVGIISGGGGWDADFLEIRFTEVVEFILVRQGVEWRIQGPVFYPHVSPTRLAKDLELFMMSQNEKADGRLQKLKNILKRLKEL